MATISEYDCDEKGRPQSVAEIVTAGGTRIYLLPIETFPGHFNNCYLVDHPEHPTLVDVGTGAPSVQAQLEGRFDEARRRFGIETMPDDVSEVVITHAHIDHHGGARAWAGRSVPIAIHELDARILEGFEERFLLAIRDFGLFLRHCGLEPDEVARLMTMYRSAKDMFRDLEPDRRLRNGDMVGPGWPVLHVPGHCPGMICLGIDDVVLTADHLLTRLTPVQRPQSITPFMGLENYLRSLEKLLDFGDYELGLGGHEAPIPDVPGRIRETVEHHEERLRTVTALCEEPLTIAEISDRLFGPQKGYGVLLALSEAGAHVEYLHDLGYVAIDNLDEVSVDVAAPARYLARDRDEHPMVAGSRLRSI